MREDAQVLQHDAEFGGEEGEVVDDDAGVEGFEGGCQLVGGEGGDVATHAVFDCGLGVSWWVCRMMGGLMIDLGRIRRLFVRSSISGRSR